MKIMKKPLFLSLQALLCLILASCVDHDDPKLSPIDTTQVKITATVKDLPNSRWMNVSEEMTVSVSDIEMNAPKGVVLKSISLVVGNGMVSYTIDDKPFSGEPMEFKVPLIGKQGRFNFSVRGNLIKKDSRDAEVMIADNIQKIIFSAAPEFECEGTLNISVTGKSTTGEEYSHSFEAISTDHFTIPVPQSELYWQPTSGTASTIDITISGSAKAWSPNTTFENKIMTLAVGHSSGDESTVKITIPNTPGALTSQKLQLYVLTSYYGTWENVTIEPYNLTNVFEIVESK